MAFGGLAGGQAVRVALAETLYGAPQFLVMDEPSNHLDMDTTEALAEALHTYTGAVLLVSHDQWLVEQVADRVYLVAEQRVQLLDGGMQAYVKQLTTRKGRAKHDAEKAGVSNNQGKRGAK